MGNYFTWRTTEIEQTDTKQTEASTFRVPLASNAVIVMNQACCTNCNQTVFQKGTCICGNVTVFGENNELGRTVKQMDKYSDVSLIEYRGQKF